MPAPGRPEIVINKSEEEEDRAECDEGTCRQPGNASSNFVRC